MKRSVIKVVLCFSGSGKNCMLILCFVPCTNIYMHIHILCFGRKENVTEHSRNPRPATLILLGNDGVLHFTSLPSRVGPFAVPTL